MSAAPRWISLIRLFCMRHALKHIALPLLFISVSPACSTFCVVHTDRVFKCPRTSSSLQQPFQNSAAALFIWRTAKPLKTNLYYYHENWCFIAETKQETTAWWESIAVNQEIFLGDGILGQSDYYFIYLRYFRYLL